MVNHVTVPVAEEPVTVAVHVVDEPTAADGDEQLTETLELIRSAMIETPVARP